MPRQIIGLLVVFLLTSVTAHAATLDVPTPHTTLSGVGVIHGWKCEAGALTVRFDGGPPLPLLHGAARKDVLDAGACDHANVGFVSIMNWGNLGDGPHTAVVYDDGIEFDRSTFHIVTTGEAFLERAVGQCVVDDFPAPGENARFIWNQATQHMELAEVRNTPTEPPVPGRCGSSQNSCVAGTFSDLSDTPSHYRWQCVGSHGGQTVSCQAAKPTPSVSRFNGTWRITLRYTSSGCTHYADERDTCTIANGAIQCAGGGRGTVAASGSVSGRLYYQGEHAGNFTGRLQERSGSGTWHNFVGCGGTWTAAKR